MKSIAWVVACVTVVCGWMGPRAVGQEKQAVPVSAEVKAPRAAVVTFGVRGREDVKDEFDGYVGIDLTAERMRELIPLLKEDRIDIVVVRVNCWGGMLRGIEDIAKVFHEDYKKEFRVVAWMDQAISAGAMATHSIGEVYFTPKGVCGACTGTLPLGTPKLSTLKRTDEMMQRIAGWGGHDPKIVRAMMFSSEVNECMPLGIEVPGALSATLDEATGKAQYFQDKISGKVLLNPKGGVHILTFDAPTALAVGFSRGTAATVDELARAMKVEKVEWVGEKKEMIDWPVCKAERRNMQMRKEFLRIQERCSSLFAQYQAEVTGLRAAEEGNLVERREAATAKLGEIAALLKDAPAVTYVALGRLPEDFSEWVEKQKKMIRESRVRGK